jgi:hypothetical protein
VETEMMVPTPGHSYQPPFFFLDFCSIKGFIGGGLPFQATFV